MILFAIQIICCNAQYQLTMVQNKRFFQKLQDMMETSGLNIQVQSPNLGFLIQGGFIQSNSTLNISQIISSSLYEEMNVIAILQFDGDYIISTYRYTYAGQYQGMINLFNVSSDDQEYYQTIANTIQAFIVEITISDYVIKLQGFQQIQLNNLIEYQQDFPFQTFKQIGFTEQLDDYSIVNFVYTTVITGGIIKMKFQYLNLLSVEQLGQLEILDSSLQNRFVNVLTVSNNQIAILNINKMNSSLITSLSVYLVEEGIEYQIPLQLHIHILTLTSQQQNTTLLTTYLKINCYFLQIITLIFIKLINCQQQITLLQPIVRQYQMHTIKLVLKAKHLIFYLVIINQMGQTII